jgi:hypothetical protein
MVERYDTDDLARQGIILCGEFVLASDYDALATALRNVMPLLAECDCIYSDRNAPLCPCRAARAALNEQGEP